MLDPLRLIDGLLARLPRIAQHCGNRFPLYAQGDDSTWQTSRGGSWMGGFWAAAWWLKALREQACTAHALRISQALQPMLATDSIHRAFVFWYGVGWPLQQLSQHTQLTQLTQRTSQALEALPILQSLQSQASQALADSFNPDRQYMPLGTALGGSAQTALQLNADALAPLVQLLSHGPHSALAQAQVNSLVRLGLQPTGAIVLEGMPQGWARGHAWAMLGLCTAAKRWGQPYTQHAALVCQHWLRTHHPNILENPHTADPSALVIAALALHMLDPSQHHAQAALEHLQASPHLHNMGDGSLRFCGARYALRPGTEALVESPWSTWMLLELLLNLTQPHDQENHHALQP